MRTLSASLLSNQKGVGETGLPYDPIWKIVLTRDGEDTKTYTKTRVIKILSDEEEFNQSAIVLLDNSDGSLTTIDFERYQGVISLGYNDSAQGDEYSPLAPLKVTRQRFFSAQGILVCQLELEGISNQLSQDKAEAERTVDDTDTDTVKTLLTNVVNATIPSYTSYGSFNATFDSEDSLIDSFIPKDYYRIRLNENRLEKVRQLLSWTGSKSRAEDDGKIHFFDPVISGANYDYEYKLSVSGEHTFFNKELTNRFVQPNKVIVKSALEQSPAFSGSKTSTTSFNLDPKTETIQLRLASDAQGTSIATARQETYELNAETGSVRVPMNVGQEVWDWIKVTDSRQNDTRTGNVRRISRHVEVARGGLVWDMEIRFGSGGVVPFPIIPSGTVSQAVQNQSLADAVNALRDDVGVLIANQSQIVEYLISREERVQKLHVTEQLIIPVVQ